VPAVAQPGHNDALANVRIDNFAVVNANYYRGAQPIGRDYADLAALGVKTVIDLQKYGEPAEQKNVETQGMRFVRIGMTTRIPPTSEQLAQFMSIVNDAASQPVYVHCAGGRHRTGVMTAVYRMMNDRWDGTRAFAEMKTYRFGADYLHPEFKQFVLGYHVPLVASTPAPPIPALPAASPVSPAPVLRTVAAPVAAN